MLHNYYVELHNLQIGGRLTLRQAQGKVQGAQWHKG
jgi:hypothetical protein